MLLPLVLALSVGPTGTSEAESQLTLPDRASAYYHFSLAQQRRLNGDAEGAMQELERARRLDPGSAAIRANIARELRDQGRLEAAMTEARAAVALDSDNALAHRILAQLYRLQVGADREDALRKAAAEFEELLRIEPRDLVALQALAAYYGELGETERAVATWARFLQLVPGSYDAHVQVARLKAEMEDLTTRLFR